MTTRPTVLVLEDMRSEREELVELLGGLGLEVWATSSPLSARSHIGPKYDWDMAVIDWDMSNSRDSVSEPTSARVLAALGQNARETTTLVYARDVGRVSVSEAIQRAHPGALIHDKAQGSASLQQRLVALMSPKVGDLELHDRYRNLVRHIPSGKFHKHRIAFRMLTTYPHEVMIERSNRTMYTGMDRFRRWLREVDSVVTVESMGKWTQQYRLVVNSTKEKRRAPRDNGTR